MIINNEREIVNTVLDIIVKAGYTVEVENDDDFFFDFHIKECKKWLFGIRPTNPKEDSTGAISYTKALFFCQYEREINKFKPSYSEYICELEPSYDMVFGEYEVLRMIKFIRKHPIRAWNRDVGLIDHNIEYHTGIGLLWRYIKRQYQLAIADTVDTLCSWVMLKFVKRKVFPYLIDEGFDSVEIYDNGENVSPRYDILCKAQEAVLPKGCYGLFGEDEYSREIEALWDKTEKGLKEFCEMLGVYRYNSIDKNIIVVKKDG